MIDELNAALTGRYVIQRELGRGGMATVYLAEDPRHGRQVAIKVLHPELAAVLGAERFLTEIEIAAGLTHPHILPLHDSGQADGLLFYVMPYVEGESLRDRLDRETQLPIEDTVRIVTEVADGLTYAHGRGVVHRDIKPANILLSEGHALIADFGIARAVTEAGGARLTETGLSLGTPHYMSPEQASGAPDIDGRSDVYALGCVAYEMLVGEPPYTGPNAQAIMAKVLTQPVPSVRAGRDTVSAVMDTTLRKALARLPADRFATAREFGEALRRSADPSLSGVSSQSLTPGRSGGRGWKITALATLIVAVGALALWAPWKGPEATASGDSSVYHLSLPTGALAVTGHAPSPAVALSPDGSQLAYVVGEGGTGQIYLRNLGSSVATPVAGAENAQGPFFSPDGEWLGFIVEGRLTKVRLADGSRVALTAASGAHGASWGADGTIVFGATQDNGWGLSRIGAAGGEPELLVPAGEIGTFLLYPSILPGGHAVLFTAANNSGQALSISAVSLITGEVTTLIEGGGMARYLPPGYLLYPDEGGLYAVRFDTERLVVESAPVRVVQDLVVQFPLEPAIAHFTVSENGTLVYLAGEETLALKQQFAWVDRAGNAEAVALAGGGMDDERRGMLVGPRISPDGQRVVFWTNDPTRLAGNVGFNGKLWMADLARGSAAPISSDSMESFWPLWTTDGQSVISTGGGREQDGLSVSLFSRRVDVDEPLRQLTHAGDGEWQQPYSIASDGSVLMYQQSAQGKNLDIWVLPLEPEGSPWPFLDTPSEEYQPAISPDGRWLAYVSNATGEREVYVVDFPEGRTRQLASIGGGASPAWSADGRELFYVRAVEAQAAMMSVDVSADDGLTLGRPRELFRGPFLGPEVPYGRLYDVSSDSQRFLMVRLPEQDRSMERVVVVLNWRQELERQLPQ